MRVTRPQRSGAAGIIPFYIMKDDNVILEMSRKDAERLEDFLDGLLFYNSTSFDTSDCLIASGRIIVLKNNFNSVEHLNKWCRRLDTMITEAKIKYIADRTDPILP